ncbi:MAG TPA: DUF1385 domain-containing protein [Thermoleophilaceae bacterium]|nr:DUF1385 domain-containing protein [Thermoleophilaceae bacterium]
MRPTPPEKLRLGGMALGNGLLVHGPTHWAAAVRDPGGELRVASGPKPHFGTEAAERVPGVRGVLRLAEALAVIPLVKRALPDARLPMQEPRTIGAVTAAALAGQAVRRSGEASRTLGREAAIAGIGVLPALLALRGGELAAYHGVEHKAIGAYENGDERAADATKEHDRCGSNLVAPLLASATAGNVAVRRVGLRGPLADAAVGLGSIAFAVEVFALAERHPDTAMARALRRPGYEIQRALGTREPTEEQLAVGEAALAEILRVEGVEAGAAGSGSR